MGDISLQSCCRCRYCGVEVETKALFSFSSQRTGGWLLSQRTYGAQDFRGDSLQSLLAKSIDFFGLHVFVQKLLAIKMSGLPIFCSKQ